MPTEDRSELLDSWEANVPQSEKDGVRKSFGMHPVLLRNGLELYKYSGTTPDLSNKGSWSPCWILRRSLSIKLSDGKVCTTLFSRPGSQGYERIDSGKVLVRSKGHG